jgi:hypothetical protein
MAQNWAAFVIKKLPVVNCHPMGENSPNLVTLDGEFSWKEGLEEGLAVACKKTILVCHWVGTQF